MHAELTRFIRCRRNHTVLIGATAHDNRFPAPTGMVKLLDRSEKRVKVNKQDGETFPRSQREIGMFVRIACHVR